MITISFPHDLNAIHPNVYPIMMLDYARNLLQCLTLEADPDDLEIHQLLYPLFIFEPTDSIQTLLESCPYGFEYVERLSYEGVEFYRIGALQDNDWIIQVLVLRNHLDSTDQQVLEEMTCAGGVEQ